MRRIMVKTIILSSVLLLVACGSQPAYYQEIDDGLTPEAITKYHEAYADFQNFDAEKVFELFLSVLLNERPLSHQSRGMIYFDDFRYEYTFDGTEFFRENLSFAMLDMNGNGIPEIIIEMAHTQLIYLILHYYNGEIFGHDFVFRSMNNIKTDGTFRNSFGGSLGVARLEFNKGIYDYVFIYQISYGWSDYNEETVMLLNGVEISSKEFITWDDFQNAKECVTWHPFTTKDNIRNIIFNWLGPVITPITFSTTMRIHEDMPEFTFYRKLGDYLLNPAFIDNERYVTVTIVDENGNLIQIIDGIVQGGHGGWMTADHELFEIQFDDFNFDGYMDMWLITAVNPGTAGGAWGYYWLWEPERGQFVKNEQLGIIGDMVWLNVDYENNQISTVSRAGPGISLPQYMNTTMGNLYLSQE